MICTLDFDPALPQLPVAFDLEAVARLFERHWPGPAGASDTPVTVRACKLQDAKYQPSMRCVTTYELEVERPGEAPRQTIGAVEISPSGIAHRLFDADPALPWLAAAADPAGMCERFAEVPESALGARAIGGCQVVPVRYKPGARCVFRYSLQTSSGPLAFFGKVLVQGSERLAQTLEALHRAGQSRPLMPAILPPVAHWPELRMVVQRAVPAGAELNRLAFDVRDDLSTQRVSGERWLRDAGACLAALHSITGVEGMNAKQKLRALTDDLEELREYRLPMAQVAPSLAARYGEALGLLEAFAERIEPAPVASHGSFRTDQLMIENSRPVMIDLDSFCWANPARDAGNFLAYLDWKAIRQPQHAAFIERAAGIFLEGYIAGRQMPDKPQEGEWAEWAEWLAIYRAASLLKIAGRRFRSLSYKEWPRVPHLIDGAFALLLSRARFSGVAASTMHSSLDKRGSVC